MQTDPAFAGPFGPAWFSSTALMFVNLVAAGVLLLEALLFYALQSRRRVRIETTLMWFALTALALAHAYYLWSIYAEGSRAPHFPPEWIESIVGVSDLSRLLTVTLCAIAVFTTLPLAATVMMTYVAVLFRPRQEPT